MMLDYDKALYYIIWGQWGDLFVLMNKTEDDILAKKVEYFLNAFHHSLSETHIVTSHEDLLDYIDYAMEDQPSEGIEIIFK